MFDTSQDSDKAASGRKAPKNGRSKNSYEPALSAGSHGNPQAFSNPTGFRVWKGQAAPRIPSLPARLAAQKNREVTSGMHNEGGMLIWWLKSTLCDTIRKGDTINMRDMCFLSKMWWLMDKLIKDGENSVKRCFWQVGCCQKMTQKESATNKDRWYRLNMI